MNKRTELKTLLIITPVLGITIIGLLFALPFYPQVSDWIIAGALLFTSFLVYISVLMYSFRNKSVSLKEFIATRPLFIKYLMLDRRKMLAFSN